MKDTLHTLRHTDVAGALRKRDTILIIIQNSPKRTEAVRHTLQCAENVSVVVVTCEGAGSAAVLPFLPSRAVH